MDRDGAMTIVGITGNVKDTPTDAQAPPTIYVPFLQNPSFGNYVVLRAATEPAALAGAMATERFTLQIIGFAAVSLALALIGVYMISYTVSRRSRETAIRSAIGAHPGDILRSRLVRRQDRSWPA